MSQSFQQKYGKRVRDFCKSVPPELNVTTEELDVHFRSCALYLWAHSKFLTNGFNKINRVYTDSPNTMTRSTYTAPIPAKPSVSQISFSECTHMTENLAPITAADLSMCKVRFSQFVGITAGYIPLPLCRSGACYGCVSSLSSYAIRLR